MFHQISVDAESAVPPYEQIRAQIAAQVASGELPVGSRLPTVRKLADDLGLAPNTVARSYRELEAAGIVATRGRAGTVVAANGNQGRQRLADAARQYADLVRDIGVPAEEALRVVKAALDDAALDDRALS